ncbi:MAG: hypothetical protein ABI780_15090 [Ardenticatenales bacterium]
MRTRRPQSADDAPDRAFDANGATAQDTTTRFGRLWSRLQPALGASAEPDPDGMPAAWFVAPPLDPRALRAVADGVVRAWREPALRDALRRNAREALAAAGVTVPDGVDVRVTDFDARRATPPAHAVSDGALDLPLPPITAPPMDEQAMRRLLAGTSFAWVLWAAFGPFDAPQPAPTATPALAADRRGWRRPLRWPSMTTAGLLAAAAAVVLFVGPVLGGSDLAGAAIGPVRVGGLLLAVVLAAAAMLAGRRPR